MSNVVWTSEARRASLEGTRQMIAVDSFDALVGALVDCRATPHDTMATVLEGLADRIIGKARGEIETDRILYPRECVDRAVDLVGMANRLRGASCG